MWSDIALAALATVVAVAAVMWIIPIYHVWAAHKAGLADLARAQNEQQIQIAAANRRLAAAAESNKRAAIVEAEAVARSIEIIGNNLQHHDLYLRWQWINMMEDHRGTTIYVPTECNLPILEATRNAK